MFCEPVGAASQYIGYKEEGVSDAIIQSIYTAIAKIETESPTASSVRRQRRRVKERTDKEAKKVNILL